MTTLVRLTTRDENARFDNQLNAEFLLEKNSSVALQNVVFEVEKDDFAITSLNNQITYALQGNQEPVNVFLNQEIYTSENTNELLQDVENQLNGSLAIQNGGKSIGGQFKVDTDTGNFVQIQYTQQPFQNQATVGKASADGVINNSVFSRNEGSDLQAYLFYDKPLARGCGVYRTRIQQLPIQTEPTSSVGVLFGLSSVLPDDMGYDTLDELLQSRKLKVGLWAQTAQEPTPDPIPDSQKYYFIDNTKPNPNMVQSNVIDHIYASPDDTNNDVMEISIELNKIRLRVYGIRNGETVVQTVQEIEYNRDDNEDLYPIVYVIDDESSVTNIVFTSDPYVDPLNDGDDEELNATNPPRQFTNLTNAFLLFNDPSLSSFLGFDSQRQPVDGVIQFTTSFTLSGLSTLDYTDLGDNFVILLDNIELDSYDTLTKERRSILATIPQTDDNKSVIYDTKFPHFIKIRNNNKLYLRNIKARILKNDLSPIVTKGLTTMCLLFKS